MFQMFLINRTNKKLKNNLIKIRHTKVEKNLPLAIWSYSNVVIFYYKIVSRRSIKYNDYTLIKKRYLK